MKKERLPKFVSVAWKIVYFCWTAVLKKDSCSYDFFVISKKLFNVCVIIVKWWNTKTCAKIMRLTKNTFISSEFYLGHFGRSNSHANFIPDLNVFISAVITSHQKTKGHALQIVNGSLICRWQFFLKNYWYETGKFQLISIWDVKLHGNTNGLVHTFHTTKTRRAGITCFFKWLRN